MLRYPMDYDLLPYPSMPFAYTQPSRLAALSTLFGLQAPAAETACVLELGCAAGGNIIPLAARFPNARFIGIDISQRHIKQGLQRIGALGLNNIELRQQDLTNPTFDDRRFDYIICHGVFSWVPRKVQDAIFRISRETLTDQGVATISYNVLPGWHLRSIVRDICLHHVGRDGSPRDRVAKARSVLASIAASTDETEPYGLVLRSEAKRIARRPSAYILGEFLVPDNTPCYFHEFTERAGKYGLSFLCEGDLNSSIPQIRDPEMRRRNQSLAGSSPMALEQYIDFFTGRTFRRSVLVRSEHATRIKRDRNLDRLRGLHFSYRMLVSGKGSKNPSAKKNAQVRIRHPSVRIALQRLAECYPATLSLEQLTENVPPDSATRLCSALLALVVAGDATASTLPTIVGRANARCPKLWSLARMEAGAKQPWLTSLNHSPIPREVLPTELVALLDGSNTRRTLVEVGLRRGMMAAAASHREPNAPKDNLSADQYIERILNQLAFSALLEPENATEYNATAEDLESTAPSR
jgi:SAM-dependent methyltransferase